MSEQVGSASVSIHLSEQVDTAVHDAVVGALIAYNARQAGIKDYRPLVLSVRDESGNVVGGLWGRTVFGWLYVAIVFLPESLRGHGIGSELMLRAEREALARGCRNAWLDTYEFQARGFYEKLGYRCFGELADYPVGFSRFFMQKALTGETPRKS